MREMVVFCAVMLLTLASGCGQQGSSSGDKKNEAPVASGGVAVVDLDEVAHRLGYDVELTRSFEQRQSSLNQQLRTLKVSLQQQFAAKRNELSENPTPEQADWLEGVRGQLNLRLNKAQKEAAGELNQHRTQMIRNFREQVRPIAREVAESKGMSLVVTKNDSVLFTFDPAIDITDDVVAALMARGPLTPVHSPASASQESAARTASPSHTLSR